MERLFTFVLAGALAACGLTVAPESQTRQTRERPETQAPSTGESSAAQTPPPSSTPRKVGTPLLPANVAIPFQILVSNQSFDLDPVDIDVYVDDVQLIAGDFLVKTQHLWIPFDFKIAAGEHVLRAI